MGAIAWSSARDADIVETVIFTLFALVGVLGFFLDTWYLHLTGNPSRSWSIFSADPHGRSRSIFVDGAPRKAGRARVLVLLGPVPLAWVPSADHVNQVRPATRLDARLAVPPCRSCTMRLRQCGGSR